MTRVLNAILRGIHSQFNPKMLALLIVPFLVAVFFWAISAWWLWDPVTAWFQSLLFEGDGWLARFARWVSGYGMGGLKHWIPNLFAFLLLLPIALVTALALIAVLSMPAVIRFLGGSEYADVQKRGSLAIAASLWNAASALALFIPVYLLTIPLWLIPPLAFVVPVLCWAWLTSKLMRFDSSVEHASEAERRQLIDENRGSYFLLGLAAAALNYFPPLFIVAPVLSALVFAHFSLARLREMRAAQAGTAVDASLPSVQVR